MDDFAAQNSGSVTFTELHGATCAEVRDKSAPGGACFVPELIHNCPGVGLMVTIAAS